MPLAHEAIDEPRVLIIKSCEINAENLEKNDARNVMVKYLIDERHDSTRFSLRLYSVNKGGKTPLDRHNYEHHVYVLNGEGVLKHKTDTNTTQNAVKQEDAIFIPSNAVHQFINNEDEPLVFLCVKGNPRLYRQNSEFDSERVGENRSCWDSTLSERHNLFGNQLPECNLDPFVGRGLISQALTACDTLFQ